MGTMLYRLLFNCSQHIKTRIQVHAYARMWRSVPSVHCEIVAKIGDVGCEKSQQETPWVRKNQRRDRGLRRLFLSNSFKA